MPAIRSENGELVGFFNELAERRAKNSLEKTEQFGKSQYESETEVAKAKKVNKPVLTLVQFGPMDYASEQTFILSNS